eukprot:6211819-Pleurochrysis_carterae.AAC.10
MYQGASARTESLPAPNGTTSAFAKKHQLKRKGVFSVGTIAAAVASSRAKRRGGGLYARPTSTCSLSVSSVSPHLFAVVPCAGRRGGESKSGPPRERGGAGGP